MNYTYFISFDMTSNQNIFKTIFFFLNNNILFDMK